MDATPVALVYLRHEGDLFVRERGDCPTVPVGTRGETPAEMATHTLREHGLEPATVEQVRDGDPIETTAPVPGVGENEPQGPVQAYPFLYECDKRPTEGTPVPPTALLDNSVLWRGYDRIRPTVETIATDATHGSTALSVRALGVLRDEAAILADAGRGFAAIESVTADLVTARPTMTALANRVCRALDAPQHRTLDAVADAAHAAIGRALSADDEAAAAAATEVTDKRVATLSRSGTVRAALSVGEPSAVLVAESRPGGEGTAVADALADSVSTTLTSDAAFPNQLGEWGADLLLVGADAVLADGRVVNKVGTFGAAAGAAHHGVRVVVATARDKISASDSFDPEPRTGALAEATIAECHNPTFEAVAPDCYDALVTERGVLDREHVRELSGEVARLRSRLELDP
jgi:translation initiation factor 2B subunit (eIF-2B alpha/beta/delta family)